MAKPKTSKIRIMLDSGAYSAWTRGEQLELGEYIDFIKRYQSDVDTYINLDVIPGSKGVTPKTSEVEYAAQASFENYLGMRKVGLRPIPVFHYGENKKWLEKLVEAGADYICLGGTVGLKTPVKRAFLDECFTMLTNARGEPIVRVHGLGVTEGQFIIRYPWHSVDSTSWMIAPIYGMILVPGLSTGDFSAQIYVADGNLGDDKAGRRFERLPESAQDHVLKFAAECGVTISDLRNDVYSRMVVFVSTLLYMQQHVAKRFERKRGSFAFRPIAVGAKRAPIDFHIIMAGNVVSNKSLRAVIKRCGAQHHLRSYYEHKDNFDSFAEYLETLNSTAPYDITSRPRPRTDWASMNYHDHRRRLLASRHRIEEIASEQEASSGQVDQS